MHCYININYLPFQLIGCFLLLILVLCFKDAFFVNDKCIHVSNSFDKVTISMLNHSRKAFEDILLNECSATVQLPVEQFGIRRRHITWDTVALVDAILRKQTPKKRCAVVDDTGKAFDSTDHNLRIYRLVQFQLPVQFFQRLLDPMSVCIIHALTSHSPFPLVEESYKVLKYAPFYT